MATGDSAKISVTVVGAVVSLPASYVVQRVLGAWGVLDAISDTMGKYLKANVAPETAGWSLGLVLIMSIYGVLLWKVWRPHYVHAIPHRLLDQANLAAARAQFRPGERQIDKSSPFVPRGITRTRDRDIGIRQALGYAIDGQWADGADVNTIVVRGLGAFNEPVAQFCAAAKAGDLRVWGRRTPNGLFQAIESAFWERNTVDISTIITLFQQSRTRPLSSGDSDEFYDLQLNRTEVERVWRHEG